MVPGILTTNIGYPPHVAQDFIENLKRVGYKGHLQLFQFEVRDLPVCTHRLYVYLRFLKDHPNQFNSVILSDLRDVIFQSDPSKISHGHLDCFLEWEGITIGQCEWNSYWIRRGFGEEEYKYMKDKPISCAGFTIGTQRGIENYLEMLISVLEKTQQHFLGADQGVHNWLIHRNIIPHTLHANETGPVYTLHHVPIITVSKHQILQRNGSIPAVVHQFDRHLSKI